MNDDPPWLDWFNLVGLVLGAVLTAGVAVVAAAMLPLPLGVFAGITSAVCLVASTPHVQAIHKRRRKTSASRTSFGWRQAQKQLSRSNARRLADEARDHATRAAELGLPTGEWTDLAAFWTTWADREDAETPATAAETPVERPKPPKGDAGVGNAENRLHRATCDVCAYVSTSDSREKAVERIRRHLLRAHASSAPDVKLPRVQASSPPCAAVEFFVVPNASPPGVPRGSQKRLKLTVPPTSGGSGRRDTVVRDSDGNVQLRSGWAALPDDEPLAQLRIPANCSTITNSMIFLACPFGTIHTWMMKGAPSTEHEVPCDCDERPHKPKPVDVRKPQLRDGEYAVSCVTQETNNGHVEILRTKNVAGCERTYINGVRQPSTCCLRCIDEEYYAVNYDD